MPVKAAVRSSIVTPAFQVFNPGTPAALSYGGEAVRASATNTSATNSYVLTGAVPAGATLVVVGGGNASSGMSFVSPLCTTSKGDTLNVVTYGQRNATNLVTLYMGVLTTALAVGDSITMRSYDTGTNPYVKACHAFWFNGHVYGDEVAGIGTAGGGAASSGVSAFTVAGPEVPSLAVALVSFNSTSSKTFSYPAGWTPLTQTNVGSVFMLQPAYQLVPANGSVAMSGAFSAAVSAYGAVAVTGRSRP